MTDYKIPSFLKTILSDKIKRNLRTFFLPLHINHLFGPMSIKLSHNEAAVTCVLKNGEFYIDAFIDHYLNMGFRHIFFLDNGSTDGTIDLIRKYSNVSVFKCMLPIEKYQIIYKQFAAEKFISNGWCLDADIDEFFDYPFSKSMSLENFVEYLNVNGFSAVLCQMIDMFSEKPLSSLTENASKEELKTIYCYYDLSNVTMVDYFTSDMTRKYAPQNVVAHENSKLLFGGIRKSLYGLNCLLTKHSLFLTGKGLDIFPHVHFVDKAKIADVSCAILHYKLASNAYETAMQNKEAFIGNSKGYRDFIRLIEENPEYCIRSINSSELQSINDLVNDKYLFCSDNYIQYINQLTPSV